MNVQRGSVAVFDSGLGGLSVLRELRLVLPGEDFVYAADSRYCPYGERTEEEIRRRTVAVAVALCDLGAKVLVVACNTASSVALSELREVLPIPIVGVEPAIKPAVARSRTGRIGVLATPRTAAGERLARLIAEHAGGATVRVVSGIGLVELVEAGIREGTAAEQVIEPLLRPLVRDRFDTVVLGCTHYPFLWAAIRAVTGPKVELIDSGTAVARRTRAVLEERDARRSGNAGTLSLLTTGDPKRVARIASALLAAPISAEAFMV